MAGLMYKNFLLYRVELMVIGVMQLFISTTVLLTGIAEIGSPEGTLLLYGCMFLIIGYIRNRRNRQSGWKAACLRRTKNSPFGTF